MRRHRSGGRRPVRQRRPTHRGWKAGGVDRRLHRGPLRDHRRDHRRCSRPRRVCRGSVACNCCFGGTGRTGRHTGAGCDRCGSSARQCRCRTRCARARIPRADQPGRAGDNSGRADPCGHGSTIADCGTCTDCRTDNTTTGAGNNRCSDNTTAVADGHDRRTGDRGRATGRSHPERLAGKQANSPNPTWLQEAAT